jgi:SAM-dependent methyltransferase
VLYAYGLKVGLALARDGHPRRALRYLRNPVSYWRGLEYALVLRSGAFQRDQRVLDIGSPKLLALYLASRVGARVVATDLDPYFVPEYTRLGELEGLSPARFVAGVEDGRQLTFADGSFDRIYSISVVEHIEGDGDARCLQEIGRVLAPGGIALLTTPFAAQSRDVYRPAGYAYWNRSARRDVGRDVFFERRYSEDDLWRRLIEPSGLSLKRLQFVGERIKGGAERDVWELIPWALGPLHPALSAVLHDGPRDSWRDVRHPALAFVVLQK